VIRLNPFVKVSIASWFESWLQGFGEIADGIVTLCSFGLLISRFEFAICKWRTMRMFARAKRKHGIV
jgi:hypothetical protein